MRIMFISLFLSLGLSVKAETLNYICEPSELVYMNKFFAQGSLDVNGPLSESILSNTRTIMSFRLLASGYGSDYVDFVGYIAEGNTKLISTMTKAPFIYSSLRLEEEGRLFDIKLLFDYSETFDSRIRDIETNQTFRANCRVIK